MAPEFGSSVALRRVGWVDGVGVSSGTDRIGLSFRTTMLLATSLPWLSSKAVISTRLPGSRNPTLNDFLWHNHWSIKADDGPSVATYEANHTRNIDGLLAALHNYLLGFHQAHLIQILLQLDPLLGGQLLVPCGCALLAA